MIAGVRVAPLGQIRDERGAVFHMLRADDPAFERFGEIYFSLVRPGWVKGWHWHSRMTINYAVPVGRIHLVLYDERDGSPTRGEIQELDLDADDPARYLRVTVPPGIWNGFLGLGERDAVVANCATIPHDPEEIRRLPPDDPRVPYRWPVEGKVKGR